jgi:hypothetical protein
MVNISCCWREVITDAVNASCRRHEAVAGVVLSSIIGSFTKSDY